MINLDKNLRIAIVGLGYVGLPLAVEFGKKYQTYGYDINNKRLQELSSGKDLTMELTKEELESSSNLAFTNDPSKIESCNIYIVTVPTPIKTDNQPDLGPLIAASSMIGSILKKDDIVIYESTVYPGATEEECVPVLEKKSGLQYNDHFYVGYSPERINPGDKSHRLIDILKVTSGSKPSIAKIVDDLYSSIITAGTFMASSIKVAEAAKVIENTQRDVNIALVNELALIFDLLNIETEEVLKAAGTKWNFLPFKPGLVGGHCIGVDPYYLTHKAQSIGYDPEIILAGRKLNDSMSKHVADKIVKNMIKRSFDLGKSKVLIMGVTFKENCPDIRNTKIFDIVDELQEFGIIVECYDPKVNICDLKEQYKDIFINKPPLNSYECILISVAHNAFLEMGSAKIRKFGVKGGVLFDLKSIFNKEESDLRL
jgi:UDP-N-acetyl-D-galactosamine dehydrogenase